MTNKEAIKRRYTFGNGEFNLEAAYHDCKLVFDGITDDSFQEADTGLILYYANEIIYALHEALEGKDTNVPSKDTIYRKDAIDAAKAHWYKPDIAGAIEQLPSAQPEIIRCKDCGHWDTTWQNDFAPNYHYCSLVDGTRRGDFFCADAERRGEQDEND